MVKACGIDLGTTNSVVACVHDDGSVEVIPNAEGDRLTPSVFAIWDNGEIVIGKLANDNELVDPHNAVRSIKRHMGTNYRVCIRKTNYSPERISAAILTKLKRDAEVHLGYTISQAVITVPAYFDSDARQATKTAGELAGFEVLRVINEPTAAALAYGLDKKARETVVVYDLGGGTFDVTVLKLSGDGMFHVQSTSGDGQLGGDDFDAAIMQYCKEQWVCDDNSAEFNAILRKAAESAKKTLTAVHSTRIVMPRRAPIELTRTKLEELILPMLERTKVCLELALRDAGIRPSKIDEIVFVGGSTRVPLVGELVEKWTGKKPNKTVNPDEAVAIGAARQAAVLSGQSAPDIVLVDVIPLTLGIETANGVMDRMIDRNTTIPSEATKLFTTTEDNQTSVAIRVYQGERLKANGNKLLGQFQLEGIPAKPRGVAEVEVTFLVDANGILKVTAKELTTQVEARVTLTGNSSLTSEEIAIMVAEAEKNKQDDEQYFAVSAAQDRILGRIHQSEAIKRDIWGALTDEIKVEIDDMLLSLNDALSSVNIKLMDELDEACQEIMTKANKEFASHAAKLMRQ